MRAGPCDKLSAVEVIELMLDCGYLRRDAKSAMRAIANLAGSGRLDLMQQIALLHSPLEEDCSNWERWSNFWIDSWIKALDNAGAFGELECVQWLVQYPIGMIACELIKKWPSFDDPTYYAAEKGHWKIVQYLCEQKISIHLDLPLDRAIRNGHIKCVEVLLQQFLNIKKQPEFCPIDVAAGCGHLEIVQFLHNFQPQDTPADQRHNESSVCDTWWSHSRNLIHGAADSGNLELVKWLHVNRPDDKTNAMDAAARSGHLDIVKWVHVHRTESCTKAMHGAATHGHLSVAKWLHSNRSEGCTRKMMDKAARQGHLDVVKWLHANKMGKCSPDTVKVVFRNGPLRVASWLHSHFPEHTPVNLNGVWDTYRAGRFEMLFFLDAHSLQCIDQQFAEDTRKFILEYFLEEEDGHILNWLTAKCPSMGPSVFCKIRF